MTRPPAQPTVIREELADKLRRFAFIRDEEQALFQTQPEVTLKAVALLTRLFGRTQTNGTNTASRREIPSQGNPFALIDQAVLSAVSRQ